MIRKNKIKFKIANLSFHYKTLVLEYPFQKKILVSLNYLYELFFMRKKNKDCIVCDFLIIGSNPILNILLADKLSKNGGNVCIWQSEDIDWWNYNLALMTEVVNEKIKSFFRTMNGNLVENMSFLLNIVMNKENVFWIDNSNKKIDKFSFVKEEEIWVFDIEDGVQNGFDTVHNGSRIKAFNELVRKITPAKKDKNIFFRKNDKSYIFVKNVYLTSFPNSIFDVRQNSGNFFISNNYDIIDANNIFGSAEKIASTGEYFVIQPLHDVEKILNTLK